MNQISEQARILGISLSSRGFGYAVLEGKTRLVDFGRGRIRGNKNVGTIAGVRKVMARYQPDVVVLQDVNKAKGTNRIPRIKALAQTIVTLARKQKIKAVKISGRELRDRLLGNEDATKHELAALMAERFPEQLASRLPVKRRTQDNEDPRMDYFDAVELVVAFSTNP